MRTSNVGNLIVYENGSIRGPSGKILKPQRNAGGYLRVNVGDKLKRVHRLVAEAFIPNPDNKPAVNHKDGDKSNNHHTNLEWATHAENSQHAYSTGLGTALCGEKHYNSKLTAEDVVAIRKDYSNNYPGWTRDTAARYGVHRCTIGDIVKGRRWRTA